MDRHGRIYRGTELPPPPPLNCFFRIFVANFLSSGIFSIGPRMPVTCCGYGAMLRSLQDIFRPPLSEFLDSPRSCSPSSIPGRGHCVAFLGKTLYSPVFPPRGMKGYRIVKLNAALKNARVNLLYISALYSLATRHLKTLI